LGDLTCGGSIPFTYIVESDCETIECTSTFTVQDAPPIAISCPQDIVLPVCNSHADILAAYNNWVAGFTFSGGCNAADNIDQIPGVDDILCGGTISFTYMVLGDCDATQCTSTFTVPDPLPLTVSCPDDVLLTACTDQQSIETAYNAWIAGFTHSGGCNATDNLDEVPSLSDLTCGGFIDFTYVVESDCDTAQCTSSFAVQDPPELLVTCPDDTILAACSSASEIAAAYDQWIAGFTHSGGCHATDNLNELPALSDMTCGGSLSFTFVVESDCDTLECSSSFTVREAPELLVSCPDDINLPACTDQATTETAYNQWIAGFTYSGGCNASDNISEMPALSDLTCGGTISFTYMVESDCDTLECTRTFSVTPAPELIVSCPGDTMLTACTGQASIQAAYNDWVAGFTFSGGCNVRDNISDIPPLENFMCGGTLQFTYVVESDCDTLECSSTFSVQDPPAPSRMNRSKDLA
jgi:hypothetical protein